MELGLNRLIGDELAADTEERRQFYQMRRTAAATAPPPDVRDITALEEVRQQRSPSTTSPRSVEHVAKAGGRLRGLGQLALTNGSLPTN